MGMREPIRTPTEQRDPPTQLRGRAAQLSRRPEPSVFAEEALEALARLLARQAAAEAMHSEPTTRSASEGTTVP